jgi:hypothetical protein
VNICKSWLLSKGVHLQDTWSPLPLHTPSKSFSHSDVSHMSWIVFLSSFRGWRRTVKLTHTGEGLW